MTTTPSPAPGEPPTPPVTNAAPEPAGRMISGFWRRLGAFCIDSAILGVVGVILGSVLFDRLAQLGPSARWIGFVIAAAYFGIGNSSLARGHTPGKRLLQIEVVDRHGAHIGLGRALLRYVVLATPFFLNGLPAGTTSWASPWNLLLGFGGPVLGFAIIYLVVFNRRTRQGVHDLVAGAYVVRTSSAGAVAAAPVWRAHFAVIGAFAAVLLVGSYVGSKFVGGLLGPLVGVRAAILATGKVHNAALVVAKSTDWHNGTTTHTRSITVTALMKQRPSDSEAIAAEIVAILLQHDPAATNQDLIQVNVVYGYDIGIAHAFITHAVQHTPAEWRTLARSTAQR